MNDNLPANYLKVVIAGGGTSGWLAAAALGKILGRNIEVRLIESAAIGRIGVGEATIPPLRTFHKLLGIHEPDFMRRVQATFKLGIEFSNWGQKGDVYIHSFGVNGKDCWACDFQHFWLAGLAKGIDGEIGQYCVELMAARQNKIQGDSKVNYAYHLDAGLYADYLKDLAENNGVKHIEGDISNVRLHPDTGNIAGLELHDGRFIDGNLFLDCTGFQALLIEGALKAGYEPYDHLLPCNSAVAIQTELVGQPKPYTQAIAHGCGWQWRIPLQHRVGNGLVYCSRYMSEDEATDTLLRHLESPAITEPRAFTFKTGRRKQAWVKNCVAIGLSAGFLEPVESTSIHLAMASILRLLKLFPQANISQANIDEFNRQTREEMDRVRNFVILHYKATQRSDSGFWRYCRDMQIPEELAHRIQLFKDTAAVPLHEKELFLVDSWVQVMLGQGIFPEHYHPIADAMTENELRTFLLTLKTRVMQCVDKMPTHEDFINTYCKAG